MSNKHIKNLSLECFLTSRCMLLRFFVAVLILAYPLQIEVHKVYLVPNKKRIHSPDFARVVFSACIVVIEHFVDFFAIKEIFREGFVEHFFNDAIILFFTKPLQNGYGKAHLRPFVPVLRNSTRGCFTKHIFCCAVA